MGVWVCGCGCGGGCACMRACACVCGRVCVGGGRRMRVYARTRVPATEQQFRTGVVAVAGGFPGTQGTCVCLRGCVSGCRGSLRNVMRPVTAFCSQHRSSICMPGTADYATWAPGTGHTDTRRTLTERIGTSGVNKRLAARWPPVCAPVVVHSGLACDRPMGPDTRG